MSKRQVVPQLTVQQAKRLAAGLHVEHIPYDVVGKDGKDRGRYCIHCGEPWTCLAARNGEQEAS